MGASAAAATGEPARAAGVVVQSEIRASTFAGEVLALTFLDRGRVAAAFAESVALLRVEGASVFVDSTLELRGARRAVRRPGGVVLAGPGGDTFWVLTSRVDEATLVEVEGDRLVERARATALPWPTAPGGLAFRPGTNLIEGAGGPLGSGPFVALEPIGPTAVTDDGRLAHSPLGDVRVGDAVAALCPGVVAVSSPAPVGSPDAVVLLGTSAPSEPDLRIEVEGPVRALASTAPAARVRLAIAVGAGPGRTRLTLVDVECR